MTEVQVLQQSVRVSMITLGVSVFISLVSIVFVILSMAFQRSHNRKSLRPFCTIVARREGGHASISISNAGMGPLLVRDIRLSRESSGEGSLALGEALPPDTGCIQHGDACRAAVLSPGASRALIEWETLPRSGSKRTRDPSRALTGFSLVISYSDVYEHEYEKIEPLDSYV